MDASISWLVRASIVDVAYIVAMLVVESTRIWLINLSKPSHACGVRSGWCGLVTVKSEQATWRLVHI